jgi:hypothetical protein
MNKMETKIIIVGNESERMDLAKKIAELSGDNQIVLEEPTRAIQIPLPEYLTIKPEDNYI